MSSLEIRQDDIPDLHGKRVIITGGSSGIGFAAATIFARKGAKVLNLDINPPPESLGSEIEYRQCDVSKWSDLLEAFKQAGDIDIAVSNAGVSEETDYFADTFGNDDELLEPTYRVLDVNLRAVLNFTKLALSHFRRRKCEGSIVITSSATAYAPEQSLPVYSASKLAVCHVSFPSMLSSLTSCAAHWPCASPTLCHSHGGYHDQRRCAGSDNHSSAAESSCAADHCRWASSELCRVCWIGGRLFSGGDSAAAG